MRKYFKVNERFSLKTELFSGSVCDLMTCQHDCLLVSHTSKLTFLSLVETLSQQGEEREGTLSADVAEIVNTLNISVLAGRQSLQHRSHLKTERQNNNETLPLTEDTSNNVIKAEISPRQRSRQSTKDDDFIDDEEEDEPWSDDTEQTTERAEEVSRPAGRPRGSKNGSGRGKICEDCGGKVLDAWKHRRQCIAINTDIKYVCHGCKKGFRRFGAIKKHFQSTKKCKSNSKNQAEYCDVMKYMEREVKGRTICYDCGCYYLTKKGIHEHRKNCSAFTQFKCFKCSRGINSMDGFHIHFSKFPECRDAPENVEILAEIVAKSHKPEFHVCYLCGAKYKAKESIEKHMMTHAEHLDYFLCSQPDCDKKFMTRKALNLHLKNHSMPKTICSICGKQIKAGSMALHMVLHTGKKIECDICGKLFQHKGVLNKHMKNAHDPKKVPKVVKEKKRRVKKEVLEVESGAVTQLPPVQSIQVQLDNEERFTSHRKISLKTELFSGRGSAGDVSALSRTRPCPHSARHQHRQHVSQQLPPELPSKPRQHLVSDLNNSFYRIFCCPL